MVRSLDSSQLLGRTREASYDWSDVISTAWVGEDGDELRIDLASAPRALVFSGVRGDLERLAATARNRRESGATA